MKRDVVFLNHILEAIRRIEENAAKGEQAFQNSHTLQDATLRNLQTMAEATQHLSQTLKDEQPAVDWRALAAFRNVLTHDYMGIDLVRIWAVVQKEVPGLKRAILDLKSRMSES